MEELYHFLRYMRTNYMFFIVPEKSQFYRRNLSLVIYRCYQAVLCLPLGIFDRKEFYLNTAFFLEILVYKLFPFF